MMSVFFGAVAPVTSVRTYPIVGSNVVLMGAEPKAIVM